MMRLQTPFALIMLAGLLAPIPVARADIFQWEYINPADPSQGKQQSATLAPHGAGVIAAPGANLSNLNLTKAYLRADLSPFLDCVGEACWINYADLTGTTLAQADLTNASLYGAILTGADLTGAEVRGVNFTRYYQGDPGGITTLQLYSTASYETHNLSGIKLSGYNLAGIDLSGQNLTGAVLSGASLSNANLSGANLTQVDLKGSVLTNANLSDAEVRGATISSITAAQLYSTASYRENDLTGIKLDRNTLSGVNLANQNLTGASFYGTVLTNANLQRANLSRASFTYPLGSFPLGSHVATNLSGANLSLANLTNARFGGGEECQGEFCWLFEGANLSFANMSGADARDAYFYGARMIGTITENMIWSDGHLAGLNLTTGKSLIVRDYENNANVGVPIVVDQQMAMDATGTLRLEFDADAWDSTISFAAGIPVTRGGTLVLNFAQDVALASQLGRTIDLFDWAGVNPTGAFTVSSPYTWDLSKLYTTGEVTLSAVPSFLPGDNNNDGTVNAADYALWRDNNVLQAGYETWQANFGRMVGNGFVLPSTEQLSANVPEPASIALLAIGLLSIVILKSRRSHPTLLNSSSQIAFATATLLSLVAYIPSARADIYQWEYINPANHALGKQPSTMLAPGGAGVNTGQGANLANRNLTKAYLIGADLSTYIFYDGDSYYYYSSDLSGTNLTNADLSYANLEGASLIGAQLTNAEVPGARLSYSGISAAQLASTASHQAHDLAGIHLAGTNLVGVNLANQNLIGANFWGTVLTGANLSQANLTNGSLQDANLTNTNLSGANFSGVQVGNANFSGSNLTPAQLYATTNY